MDRTFTPPFTPRIPNTHAVIEKIAANQVAGMQMLQQRLDSLIALQEKQNQLLEQLLVDRGAQG